MAHWGLSCCHFVRSGLLLNIMIEASYGTVGIDGFEGVLWVTALFFFCSQVHINFSSLVFVGLFYVEGYRSMLLYVVNLGRQCDLRVICYSKIGTLSSIQIIMPNTEGLKISFDLKLFSRLKAPSSQSPTAFQQHLTHVAAAQFSQAHLSAKCPRELHKGVTVAYLYVSSTERFLMARHSSETLPVAREDVASAPQRGLWISSANYGRRRVCLGNTNDRVYPTAFRVRGKHGTEVHATSTVRLNSSRASESGHYE